MFILEPTPNTSGYMIAGYAVAFIVMAIYIASLYIRSRNLNRDLAMLEEMEKSAAPVKSNPPKPRPKKAAKPVTKR